MCLDNYFSNLRHCTCNHIVYHEEIEVRISAYMLCVLFRGILGLYDHRLLLKVQWGKYIIYGMHMIGGCLIISINAE